MKKIFLLSLLIGLFQSFIVGQCSDHWIHSYTKNTLRSPTLAESKFNIDSLETVLQDCVSKLIIPFAPKDLIDYYKDQLDSLKKAGNDSLADLTKNLIRVYSGNSQIVGDSSSEFLFHRADTFRINFKKYVVYQFSSTLCSFWNIDFNMWHFYYCPQFGIIKYKHSDLWGYFDYPDGPFLLAAECANGESKILIELQNHHAQDD